jgi:hypothetical protein
MPMRAHHDIVSRTARCLLENDVNGFADNLQRIAVNRRPVGSSPALFSCGIRPCNDSFKRRVISHERRGLRDVEQNQAGVQTPSESHCLGEDTRRHRRKIDRG